MIEIILPTFNGLSEEDWPYFEGLSTRCDLIIVNSGERNFSDHLQRRAKILQVSTQSRAERLNRGIEFSSQELILLHHPRSRLAPSYFEDLKALPLFVVWGAFSHRFDLRHPLLDFTSWYSNKIRGDRKKIYYLDHCLFLRRAILDAVFPLPRIDIFEDTVFCERLKSYPCTRLATLSTTSAIRFKQNGVWKQALLNQWMKLLYRLRVDHRSMNHIYEKKTELNSKYRRSK